MFTHQMQQVHAFLGAPLFDARGTAKLNLDLEENRLPGGRINLLKQATGFWVHVSEFVTYAIDDL
jgi:hypothetical protein